MKHLLLSLICIFLTLTSFGKEYTLFSPDNKIEVVLALDSKIGIIAHSQSHELFKLEDIALEIEGEDFTSGIKKIRKAKTSSINRKLYPPVREKYSEINEVFNELTISFRSNYSFIVRVYNEGIAYRFQTFFPD